MGGEKPEAYAMFSEICSFSDQLLDLQVVGFHSMVCFVTNTYAIYIYVYICIKILKKIKEKYGGDSQERSS